jgi:EmrB/QacA subfamily drug resistance transporter
LKVEGRPFEGPSTFAVETSEPAPASCAELSKREVRLTLAGVLLVMLLAALDQTVVGTAMPRIIADLHGFEHYAWVTTAFMLTSTTVVPIVGKLSDLYGRKRFYLVGLVVFLAGSALCGAASGMTELVLFRGLQGAGAGVVQAIAFIVIGDLFPPAQRGKLQGLFAGVFGLAALIGPPLGGYLTDALSWRWIFYVNLPLGLVALAVVLRFFPHIVPRREHGGIDYAGAVTLVCGVVPLLLALSWGGRDYAWTSPQVLGLLLLAAAMLVGFVVVELRAREPIIPPGLFKQRTIALAITASFMLSVGMFGTILFFPLFVQAVLGASATASGRVFLPMMGGMILASVASGWAISRFGRYKPAAVVGPAVMTAGMVVLSRLGPTTSLTSAGLALFVVGAGLGTVFPVYTIVVQNAASAETLGAATSAAQFFRQIGGTLGAAVLGALLTARYATAIQTELVGAGLQLAPDQVDVIMNPQALLGRSAESALTAGSSLPGSGAVALAVRLALASSLESLFLVGALAVAAALVASIMLPEVPLRRGRFARRVESEATAAG